MFTTKKQATIGIGEIMAYPSYWVNRTVNVEGTLGTPLFFMPSESAPYNCLLSSNNGSIGVRWTGNWPNTVVAVQVSGVLRIRTDANSLAANQTGIATIFIYIEADRIVLI